MSLGPVAREWGLAQAASPTSPAAPQFGSGDSYQSACPPFPPPPAGYAAWNASVNGAVPANVQAAASALANDMSKPLGFTSTVYSGGVAILLRVEPHTWTTNAAGDVVAGCFHGCGAYLPQPGTSPTSPPAQAGMTGTGLLVASIGLGAVVSVLTIWDFFRRRKS